MSLDFLNDQNKDKTKYLGVEQLYGMLIDKTGYFRNQ